MRGFTSAASTTCRTRCCRRPSAKPTRRATWATTRLGPTTSWTSGCIAAGARGTVGLGTSAGRLLKVNVLELPAMPAGAGAVALAGGTRVTEFAAFGRGETVVGLAALDGLLDGAGAGLALGT